MSDFFRKLFGGGKGAGGKAAVNVDALLAQLPFEAKVVAREDALATVLAAHRERPERHAFMLGGVEDLPRFIDGLAHGAKPEASLKSAEGLTLELWLAEREREWAALKAEHGEFEEEFPSRGPWPDDAVPSTSFGSEHDIPIFGNQRVIAQSPAPLSRWWETFAHSRFGGWNACPRPEVHMMLGRLWAEQHGAVLVAHTHDALEFAIARPIATREAALAMARMHCEYCGDNFNEATLEEYAASLIGATVWGFWWD